MISLVPILVTVAATMLVFRVALAMWRRRTHRWDEGLFTCRLRTAGSSDGPAGHSWPRRPVKARWVHDVLVVSRGGWAERTEILPVTRAHGRLGPTLLVRGQECVLLRLELDDGSTIDVAARSDLRDALGGPFLGAHAILDETHG